METGIKKIIKKLVTHNGSFHTDDIFACATLSLLLAGREEEVEIIRTRDVEIIKKGDYVFDVGGIYEEKSDRFDHHQIGGAGKRDNGIEYASFGLVWKKFGEEVSGLAKVSETVEKKLVAPIDAGDNGFDLVVNRYEVSPYLIQYLFSAMRPTWREEDLTDDEMFIKCVCIAKDILSREIIQAKDGVLAEEIMISTYKKTSDKRIIILDKNYSSENTLKDFPEPLYVIAPRRNADNVWIVRAIRDDPKSFKNRKNLPKSWAGLRDEELANVTGVADAVFCHRALFLAIAKSKEGAIKLAQIAVESQ